MVASVQHQNKTARFDVNSFLKNEFAALNEIKFSFGQ